MQSNQTPPTSQQLSQQIKQMGLELGFQQVGITDTQLDSEHKHYNEWIERNFHGEMSYMERNIDKRFYPSRLVPDTLSVICVRLDYYKNEGGWPINLLNRHDLAYVSRYALGRDYHKLIRKRLQQFASQISTIVGDLGYRVFTDSAPVLEKALAAKAGIGWQGKNSVILNKNNGSWFFLGEIFTNLTLENDSPVGNHCGSCTSCIDVCPTKAIVAPYVVDSRRCISYLTIESKSAIPIEFREAMGNRVFGCDDCQLFCPWNQFAKQSKEPDFNPRHGLDNSSLMDLFNWTEDDFYTKTLGSAIRRIGFQSWIRNIAIALGNADYNPHIIACLKSAYAKHNGFIQEHIDWAIDHQQRKQQSKQQ